MPEQKVFEFVAESRRIGHPQSPETRAKIAATMRGRKKSPEHTANMRGRVWSEKSRHKASIARLGKTHNAETRLRMSLAKKGHTPWNKGKPCREDIAEQLRQRAKAMRGVPRKPHTAEARRKMSIAMTGVKRSPETCAKIAKAKLGVKRGPHSIETRLKMSASSKGQVPWSKGKKLSIEHVENLRRTALRGPAHPLWRGGKNPEAAKARNCVEYRLWREAVLKRDAYTCQNCFAVDVKVHADHIKPFSRYPELRYEVTNGRTLCVPCHFRIGWMYTRDELALSKRR